MTKQLKTNLFRLGALAAVAAVSTGSAPADESWEWEESEGYHEEEWYDPSDWFDSDETIDYEYDYDYYADDYWTSNAYNTWGDYGWYSDYDYDYDYASDSVYAWDYENNQWSVDEIYDPVDYTNYYDYRSNDSMNSDSEAEMTQFSGQIAGFRNMKIKDAVVAEERTFAKMTLEDGTSRVIDLGRKTDLETLGLSVSDQIMVEGTVATVADRNVLKAQTVKVGEETFNLDRDTRPFDVEGKIVDFRKASLGDERPEHLLLRLEFEKGKELIADLGPDTTLAKLKLEEGDRVRIRGNRATVDGKSILVAKQVMVDGEKMVTSSD